MNRGVKMMAPRPWAAIQWTRLAWKVVRLARVIVQAAGTPEASGASTPATTRSKAVPRTDRVSIPTLSTGPSSTAASSGSPNMAGTSAGATRQPSPMVSTSVSSASPQASKAAGHLLGLAVTRWPSNRLDAGHTNATPPSKRANATAAPAKPNIAMASAVTIVACLRRALLMTAAYRTRLERW